MLPIHFTWDGDDLSTIEVQEKLRYKKNTYACRGMCEPLA